jgi:hypothetical protein
MTTRLEDIKALVLGVIESTPTTDQNSIYVKAHREVLSTYRLEHGFSIREAADWVSTALRELAKTNAVAHSVALTRCLIIK